MTIFLFIIYFGISWLGLMWLFSFSTYHKYFRRTLVFLVIYSILNLFLIGYFNFNFNFLILYYSLTIFSLIIQFINLKSKARSLHTVSPAEDLEAATESLRLTKKYHLLSTLVYALSPIVFYLFSFLALYLLAGRG